MAKSPFEKVRSLAERKKLFETLLQEQTEILCKGEDESLFHFRPSSIVSDSVMHGWMEVIENLPQKDTEVLGNFLVGSERYFFQAQLKVKGDESSFQISSDVFRLQRRSALRLYVNPVHEMYLAITEHQGKAVYSIAQVADVSAGGVRIFFSDIDSLVPAGNSKVLPLKIQDKLKAVLHLGNKKSIDVVCEIRHTQQAVHRGLVVEHFGVEFVDLTTSQKNRLLAMTMDLQKRMAIQD
jgi:c-di-GMP-binding flagellar brake protein YcgR